jgi:hypothetical protein
VIRKYLKSNLALAPLIILSIKTIPDYIPYIDLTEAMTSNAKVNMSKLLCGTNYKTHINREAPKADFD